MHRALHMSAGLALGAIVLLCGALPAAAGRLGVVLLHDAAGTPQQLAKLADGLMSAGFSTSVPELCWSKLRLFDKAYPDCLKEVDAAVTDLRKQGATAIVVGGAGQGAVFAIDYGAAHTDLVGVVAIGPSADPPDSSRYPDFAASLKAAQAAVKKRQGQTPAPYVAPEPDGLVTITTTPLIYLSFHGPQSPVATIRAIKGKGLPKLKAPLLWVSGTGDPSQASTRAVFAAAPDHKLSRYLRVEADHAGTADAAATGIVAWLKSLGS